MKREKHPKAKQHQKITKEAHYVYKQEGQQKSQLKACLMLNYYGKRKWSHQKTKKRT